MQLTLFRANGDPHRMTKTLTEVLSVEGSLRDSSEVVNPTITIATDYDVSAFNYAWIPIFNRYYYIREMISVRTGVWQISLHVDVLMTYRAQILDSTGIVDKQQDPNKGSPYLDDHSLMTTVQRVNQTLAFPGGFSDTPYWILATAGGS